MIVLKPLPAKMHLGIGTPLFAAMSFCLSALATVAPYSSAFASDPAEQTAVGKTVSCTLGNNEQKEYVLSLAKGDYCIICDEQASDDKNVIQAKVTLLKNNGASLDDFSGALIHWYEYEGIWREGKTFHIAKPFGARLRVSNTDLSAGKLWITVVPLASLKRLPFGDGQMVVTPATVGAQKGTGGTFKVNQIIYQSVTLPAGKWSFSLGLKRPAGKQSYVRGRLVIADANGFVHDPAGKRADYKAAEAESTNGDEARGETTITLVKPTTLLLRAKNISNNGGDLDYDVTIEKATD